MDQLIAALFAFVISFNHLPKVEIKHDIVPAKALTQLLCMKGVARCQDVHVLYLADQKVLLISDSLDLKNPSDRAVVAHEATKAAFLLSGITSPTMSCKKAVEHEAQARVTSINYLQAARENSKKQIIEKLKKQGKKVTKEDEQRIEDEMAEKIPDKAESYFTWCVPEGWQGPIPNNQPKDRGIDI